MVHKVLHVYHDEFAHCGTEKTFQDVSANYWFPSMRSKIKSCIEDCLTCLMASVSSNWKEGELQTTPTAKNPFQIMHTDHFGPLPESREGNTSYSLLTHILIDQGLLDFSR